MSSTVTVLYFAALRDLSGHAEERVDLSTPSGSVAEFLGQLQQRHTALAGRLSSVRVAVNEEFVEPSAELREGDVVALIPPVSGG